jgi:hypothetical protein
MVKFLNLAFFAVMIVMNVLANALPLNNKTTGELSDSFPNLFVPAGITFSIWGVIYLLLLAYCVVQFTVTRQDIISGISLLFGISCLLNALWIVFWHYGMLPLSLADMIALLVILIMINTRIAGLPNGIIKAAFGIYLGWICIATIANATALLVHYNWNGFGISGERWAIIMIFAGMIIASMALYRFRNPFIALSVIWAFAGIIIKRQADYRSIVISAAIAITLVLAVMVWGFFRKTASL